MPLNVFDNILGTIGHTPLVRLNRITRAVPATVYAKIETFNPGNSIKDRMAVRMIEDAERQGLLKPGGTIVEGTSGNYLVENNVAVDNAVYPAYNGISCNRRSGNVGIWDSAPATTTVDHNLVYLSKPGTMYVFGSSFSSLAAMQAATGQERHGVQADPRFTNPAGGTFTLQAGSPAIDRANSTAAGTVRS